MGKNDKTGVCGEDGCNKDIVKDGDEWKHKDDADRDPLVIPAPGPFLGK
jgi:hypothetical protein